MRNLLNVMIWLSIITIILTGCMLDSESLIPTAICAGSIAVLAITCLIRERLC